MIALIINITRVLILNITSGTGIARWWEILQQTRRENENGDGTCAVPITGCGVPGRLFQALDRFDEVFLGDGVPADK